MSTCYLQRQCKEEARSLHSREHGNRAGYVRQVVGATHASKLNACMGQSNAAVDREISENSKALIQACVFLAKLDSH